MRIEPLRSEVVVACLAALGVGRVPVSLVVVLSTPDADGDTEEHVGTAEHGGRAGWVTPGENAEVMVDGAQVAAVRVGLVRLVGEAAASAALWAGVDDLESRPAVVAWPGPFGGRRTAVEWVRSHREVLLTGVRVAAVGGLGRQGCALARSLWALTEVIESWRSDGAWRGELSRWGEQAARRWPNAAALAALVERSAVLAEDADDFLTAESQWVRALALRREVHDEPRVVAALEALIGLFVRWGRLHRALDVSFELVAVHRRHGALAAQAAALCGVADLMVMAGRPDSALAHLRSAAEIYESLPGAVAVEHAQVLLRAGRVLWERRTEAGARRYFHTALSLVVDVDEPLADHIRALLATSDGQALPVGTQSSPKR